MSSQKKKLPNIGAWDRRYCNNCKRDRVHFGVRHKPGWYCIGTLESALDVVAKCGDLKAEV